MMPMIVILIWSWFTQASAQSTCPPDPFDPGFCASLQFETQRNLLLQQYQDMAVQNNPDGALEMLAQFQSLIALGFRCSVITSCASLTQARPSISLGMGWSMEVTMQFSDGPISAAGDRTCRLVTDMVIANGEVEIRGMIAQSTGRLMYEMPEVQCTTGTTTVTRQSYVNEGGVLVTDYSSDTSQVGSWSMFRGHRRTPQLHVTPEGRLRIVTVGDHYFEFDPSVPRVVASDLFDVERMFNSATCQTELTTVSRGADVSTRAVSDVAILPRARRTFGRSIMDYGGARQETLIHEYIDRLTRDSL
jgi:hypothetical protein